jgi:diguanylate cyclase (GGDEF)-like protein
MPRCQSDPSTSLVNEEIFEFITDLEVRKAVRLQYYLSLLAIEPEMNGDIQEPAAVVRQLAQLIQTELRGTDLITLGASPRLHVLLVNAQLYNLPAIIERIVRQVSRHRFEVDHKPQAVALSIGGACFPTTARGREDLFGQVTELVAEAQRDRTERYRYRLSSVPL